MDKRFTVTNILNRFLIQNILFICKDTLALYNNLVP